MDARKCKILIRGILTLPLMHLELSNCQLDNECGISIGKFLLENSTGTLKSLELKGNNLKADGLRAIGYGLQGFRGELVYIGGYVFRFFIVGEIINYYLSN